MIKTSDSSENWVRDAKRGTPLQPKQQPGYYPGYSTMGQRKFWDETTRRVIEDRVYNVPKIRFFDEIELLTMTAVADRLLPQDDRLPEFRISIVNYIDERLSEGKIDGYRFVDMPPDREAYRIGLKAIDDIAREVYAKPFVDLGPLQQDYLLKSLHHGKPAAKDRAWKRMSVERFWHLLIQDCVTAYYSHPWAWDEIGFGGPAYPRAYTRLENGMPEPWEVDEQRYEWEAPPNSLSDQFELLPSEASAASGQGGTH